MTQYTDHPALGDTIAILERLVAMPCLPFQPNLAIIDAVEDVICNTGARIHRLPSPDGSRENLFASIGPDIAGGIMLAGHTDVIPVEGQAWTMEPFKLTPKAGKLYARGSCDMKGFNACAISAFLAASAQRLIEPLHLALTFDEEVGCIGAQALVADLERLGIRPRAALVGEPTEVAVVDAHKGCYEYTTHITGLAAHGSLPDKGVNAIEIAARYIAKLKALASEVAAGAPHHAQVFDPPHTTLQIGRITGGTSRNTIAPHCTIEWEMRPVQTADADHIKRGIAAFVEEELLPEMQAVFDGCDITMTVAGEVVGLAPERDNALRDLCLQLTRNKATQTVSFGTEAGIYQAAGMQAIVCGPGAIDQAHKPDEYIEQRELTKCLHLLDGIVETLCKG